MMLLLAGAVVLPLNSAQAIGTSLDLGTSGSYSVLAGQAVTNTGPSTLEGDLGVSPGSALTGFPSDQPRGASHAGDANSAQAQSDLTIAYNNAAGQASDADVDADLGELVSSRVSTPRQAQRRSPGLSPSTQRATPTPCSSFRLARR